MGRSNKVRHRLRVSFFRRTILLLIYLQFLQFCYQCIKKTSIYHIIGNFPQNCHRNTRKTDKDYDFLQSAKLTCVGDLWTQALRSISQSPRATSIRNHSPTSFGISLYRRDFPFSEFKGHPRRLTLRIVGSRSLCPSSVCLTCSWAFMSWTTGIIKCVDHTLTGTKFLKMYLISLPLQIHEHLPMVCQQCTSNLQLFDTN